MNMQEVMAELSATITEAKTAILATVDEHKSPSMRWITPGLLSSVPGSIFFLTSPASRKITHLRNNPSVQWSLQTASLQKIINVDGQARIHESPGLINEVLETVASRLTTFWKVNPDQHSMVVVETRISQATLFNPLSGEHKQASFSLE